MICTDVFVVSAHISACQCGHVFHEECLMRWVGTKKTCPQCRARVVESTIIKRLYMTEADASATQMSVASGSMSAEEACERASHKQEQMLNQIEELRATVRQKDEYLTAKRHEIDLVNQSQAHAFIIRFSSQL